MKTTRALLFLLPVLVVLALLITRLLHSSDEASVALESEKPRPSSPEPEPQRAELIVEENPYGFIDANPVQLIVGPDDFDATHEYISEETVDRFRKMFVDFVRYGYTPEQALEALQAMHLEDSAALVQAMITLESAPLELNQRLLPLMGEAFVLWPDVKGVYLAFLGYPYQAMDPSQAAEWASKFLVTNGRKDLVVAASVGNLAATNEARALELVEDLPELAKKKAVGSLADNVDISDYDHLMDLAHTWDPDGQSHFTERVFHRLGFERLDETAAWLASNPDADPAAAAAIAVHMVVNKKHGAIEWADSLQNQDARVAAISATYQRWSISDFDGAVADILTYYPDDHQLVADVFAGTTYERAGSAVQFWDQALALENESARTYALTGLLEPMLLSHGLEATEAHIDSLPEGSVERETAELTLAEVVKRPVIGKRLADLERMAQDNASQVIVNEM